MISEEIIEKIKEQNNIVDVISESVKLKRTGRNLIGLCPFHNEKTPSFSVSEDKQIYKCFGCGEAGNVFTFVMKSKNLSFIEAVKYLGDKANIHIEENDEKNKIHKNKNDKLYKINVEAARYYFRNLQTNKEATDYFKKRGILNKTLRRFGLGYAPSGWHNIMNFLKKKGYTELDLLNAGLIIKGKNNSLYDRFRNRVIFPVFDYKGRVIGFGGRVLDDSKPKYLNSPETDIFKKGTNLYGLNFAIKDNNRTIIIVEGYMDCISLYQYGITNVVASLGTALTYDQAKLLKRYADKIIVSYDADFAGQNATMRGLKILKKQGFDLKVLDIPDGKDPDEFIKNHGKDAFMKLINDALPLVDYEIKMAKYGLDITNEEMLMKYVNNACKIINKLNPIEKDIYIRKLSQETRLKEQAIYDLLNSNTSKNYPKSQQRYTKDNFGQKLYIEPAYMKTQRNLIKIMTSNIDNYGYVIDTISEEDFIIDSHKKIFKLIKQEVSENIDNLKNIYKSIEMKCDDVGSSREWIKIQQVQLDDDVDCKELVDAYIKEIKKFKLEESKEEIMKKIKYYEAQGLFEESLNLVKELEIIQNNIMSMNNCERR
ncbi:DNA primase [Clostridium botulinum D/C]|uniref:DNA primase n=1 Tax=Clostridium botulinum TaxID=1491 RepID=UPI001E5B6F8E|nr:DNA primase [Clostridium botulinum]MCD3350283.1 DNA primase [Clostridium botulinum D/C]MCD3359303.1 DNA primase [Clostridium botulinum D/C]MCD3363081.1 DNA primase [Clostridium botulinum D/C]MCD3365048.1 DNA primase [Clostridium botulinum D/C]